MFHYFYGLNPKPIMKTLLPILFIFILFGCKNDPKKEIDTKTDFPSDKTSTPTKFTDKDFEQKQKTFNLKRQELVGKEDQRTQLENLVISKSLLKESDGYVMDFEYPHLNAELNPIYDNFNKYISKNYLDTNEIERQIQDEKRLCDSLGIPQETEKRIIEYKIYNLNDRLISVLFYKENHYTGAAHASYTFETLNFDLVKGDFMKYDSFFNDGSEEKLRKILNELLVEKINSGDLYYDCWAISSDDFLDSKNNFVITENSVEYYFDDCIICPSYTGTYSIQIPLDSLMPVLKKNKRNPLLD